MFPVQETITITPSMLQDKVAVSVNYPWGFYHANISCVIGVGEKKDLGKSSLQESASSVLCLRNNAPP